MASPRKPRVNPYVPTRDVDRWLGRIHVATPDDVMVAQLSEMIEVPASNDPRWTAAIKRQTIRYALWRHHKNLAEYRWVMGGH